MTIRNECLVTVQRFTAGDGHVVSPCRQLLSTTLLRPKLLTLSRFLSRDSLPYATQMVVVSLACGTLQLAQLGRDTIAHGAHPRTGCSARPRQPDTAHGESAGSGRTWLFRCRHNPRSRV